MSSQVDNLCTLPSQVLLATDLTDLKQTLPVAIDYGLHCGAELKLIHVLADVNTSNTDPGRMIHIGPNGARRYAETILENAAKRVRLAGVNCDWIVRTGQVADSIQQFIQERNPDRLVVGSHGRQKLEQRLMGSVAESILREVEVPVLAIGPTVQHDGKLFAKGARILFATALDRESRAAAAAILELARIHQADLSMLHVMPAIIETHPSAVRVRAYAERMFQEILAGIGTAGLHPSCMIEGGRVVDTILRVAEQGRFDLIVLGAVSGSSFRREIMPGTAYGVICSAPCPVLVLKEAVPPHFVDRQYARMNQHPGTERV